MFDEVLITGDHAERRRTGAGDRLRFKARLPWYRSIYLSCFERIDLSINGEEQSLDRIAFSIYGTEYAFDDLKKHHKVLWYVLDEAAIIVDVNGLPDLQEAEIRLALHFRVPYYKFNVYLQVATCKRTLPIVERIAA